jgi:aminopeptidase N
MTAQAVHLKDYSATPFVVSHIALDVTLHATQTCVKSVLHISRRPNCYGSFCLDGEGLELVAIEVDGTQLLLAEYVYAQDKLTIHEVPDSPFQLTITQLCNPKSNTALSGLYLSSGTYCTQMEAEGFRRFAFMYDRPDVMATYHVRIDAPKSLPVILCNGNLLSSGQSHAEGRYFAEWQDPHPKPTYLFALVAGDLDSVHDHFKTSEGREVALGIYVEKGKQDRCAWAMESLKASMRWDEERFGRPYDLDVFNIVAVSDFNMGAMENKGLNIFNDKYILARPDTATDTDYVNIERIIAHEYFHNWTGNRITCRDWFQLCLKEGLTVFRDQEFTSDLRSRSVKRIEDVKTLRARQFPEDQGPLAHAVRPESYIEINNFYTPTIYEKGAEICRMLLTLLGKDMFRAALDLYFDRHDGHAATIEDFLRCMSDASGRDLSHFAKWYEQAGTPIVDVKTRYDETSKQYSIELQQHLPDTPNQISKPPLHIPLALELLQPDGTHHALDPRENETLKNGVFEFTTAQATLTFSNITSRPVLSVNRGFSAPIILRTDATDDDLLCQMARDSDTFNRWDAAQNSAKRLLTSAYGGTPIDVRKFADGLASALLDTSLDNAFKALLLQLPSEADLTVAVGKDVDATQIHSARVATLREIAGSIAPVLISTLEQTQELELYKPDTAGTARRSLRSAALSLLSYANEALALTFGQQDFAQARNMTTEIGTIGSLLGTTAPVVDEMLEAFHQRHKEDPLLLDKWFMLRAARAASVVDIEALTTHPTFTFKNPNRVYALLGGFTGSNLKGFHALDGSSYRLLAACITILNDINPQVAARMANAFRSWGRYDAPRRAHASAAMQSILSQKTLSNDVLEIISRTLNG